MAMISPICLENLVKMGKWMGLAHEYMELYVHEQQAVIAGEDLGQGRKFKALADYNFTEMDGAAQRMMEYCPQMSPPLPLLDIGDPVADPHLRFVTFLAETQRHLSKDDLGSALSQMRDVEEALMEWMNDIAFAGPSRVAVRT